MKKVGTIKMSIYIILLIGAIAFLVYTKIQASYPLGEKELQNHLHLATVPNTCKKCNQTFYYRNPENNNCNIKKVESMRKNGKETFNISQLTLNNRIEEKGDNIYIMPLNTHTLFSKQCFDFSKK